MRIEIIAVATALLMLGCAAVSGQLYRDMGVCAHELRGNYQRGSADHRDTLRSPGYKHRVDVSYRRGETDINAGGVEVLIDLTGHRCDLVSHLYQ